MSRPLKILILDNTREEKSFGSRNLVQWALKTAPMGSEILVRRSPDFDLPKNIEYDAQVISGSITSCLESGEPWIAPYDDFITRQIQKGSPILGVCYGHQTIARCLFRMSGQEPKLGKAQDAELGWQNISRVAKSKIFEGLPEKFVTYESHYEEVTALPPGAKRLAETERCAIQAFEVEGKPIFGLQFHPEYSVEEAEFSLANKLKKGERKDWILNAGKGPKLYDENVGNTIFGNFFKIADEHRQS